MNAYDKGRVTVTCGGKYKTINDNGKLTIYRNDFLWNRNLNGDGYILSLVQRIEELEDFLYRGIPFDDFGRKKLIQDIKEF